MAENKQCQNCKSSFQIDASDFEFYQKMNVPAPTWCPECRFMRRITFRNERNLYKRKCDLCHKEIIAMYPVQTEFPVYCNQCWYSDEWDSSSFCQNYDFSKPFFIQFKELLKIMPRPALVGSKNVNSPYVNYTADVKNCYFCVGCGWVEDGAYIYRTLSSKDIFDGFVILDSECAYESINCTKNSKVSFSQNAENSLESAFLYDCRNVSNCMGCVNLRNKTYNILNKQLTKEEYSNLTNSDYDSGSFAKTAKIKEKFSDFKLNFPRKFSHQLKTVHSAGDDLVETKKCENSFSIKKSENVKYGYFGSALRDSYDLNFADTAELVYESTNITENYKKLFSATCWFSKEISYCDLCFNSSDLFGCIGLRNKQYCILNKQYTKEEYEDLVSKIIAHMG